MKNRRPGPPPGSRTFRARVAARMRWAGFGAWLVRLWRNEQRKRFSLDPLAVQLDLED